MSTDRFTHFRAKAADVSAFPFFARVTFPPVASVMEILRELFIAVTRDKVTLPEKPIEDAVFSVRGDGLMKLNDSYLMLVHDKVSVEVERTQTFHLRARTEPDLIYAVRTLRFAMELKGWSWKDDFTKLPKRADRARIEAEVGAFIDPAPAWALHGGIHPRGVFLEEQFETCPSCGGSALDSYAGACYACSYNGKNLVGWKHLPYPSKLSDVILFASDLMAFVPLAALAAILFMVAWGMSEHHRFIQLLRMPNGDRGLLLLTFGLTVLVDLTVAIGVGVTLASLLFMMRMSRTVEIANDSGNGTPPSEEREDIHQRDALPPGVEVFRVDGPVFFGVANELLDTLRRVGPTPKVIILRLWQVPLLDASGVTAIEEIVRQAASAGTQIIVSGVQAQPMAMLKRVSLGPADRRVIFSDDFPDALRLARAIILAPTSAAQRLN